MKRTPGAPTPQRRPDRASGPELRRRFSLTPTEAKIALLLAEGLTYAEVARYLGVSYHTVHTHIKAIHTKAHVSSNGRLLALILDSENA